MYCELISAPVIFLIRNQLSHCKLITNLHSHNITNPCALAIYLVLLYTVCVVPGSTWNRITALASHAVRPNFSASAVFAFFFILDSSQPGFQPSWAWSVRVGIQACTGHVIWPILLAKLISASAWRFPDTPDQLVKLLGGPIFFNNRPKFAARKFFGAVVSQRTS